MKYIIFISIIILAGCHGKTRIQKSIPNSSTEQPAHGAQLWKQQRDTAGHQVLFDLEAVFDTSETNYLDSIIRKFNEDFKFELILLTVDSSQFAHQSFNQFTLKLANGWGIGKDKTKAGVLFAVSVSGRVIRVQNSYAAQAWISDDETDDILQRWCIPAFKRGEYFTGVKRGVEELIGFLESRVEGLRTF